VVFVLWDVFIFFICFYLFFYLTSSALCPILYLTLIKEVSMLITIFMIISVVLVLVIAIPQLFLFNDK